MALNPDAPKGTHRLTVADFATVDSLRVALGFDPAPPVPATFKDEAQGLPVTKDTAHPELEAGLGMVVRITMERLDASAQPVGKKRGVVLSPSTTVSAAVEQVRYALEHQIGRDS